MNVMKSTFSFLATLLLWSCAHHETNQASLQQTRVLAVVEKGTSSLGFYTEQGQLINSLKLDTFPHEMRISGDRRKAFVTNNGSLRYIDEVQGGNTISVINLQKMEKEEDIVLDPYRRPHGIDIDYETGYLAVSVENPDQILLIDPDQRKIIGEFDNHGDLPHMVTISQGAEWLFVSNVVTANLVVINTKTKEHYSIDVGENPQESEPSEDQKTLFVVCSNYTSVIDLEQKEEISRIPVGGNRLELIQNGEMMLVSASSPRTGISFVNTSTLETINHIEIPYTLFSIHVSENEEYAYASAEEQNIVYVIDIPSRKIIRKFKVAEGIRPDPVQSFMLDSLINNTSFNSELPSFERVTVDSNFEKAYQVKTADINGDNKPDILAVSDRLQEVVWYENPDWEKHVMLNETRGNIDINPFDIDGDRDIDVALASGFSNKETTKGGHIYWLENPGDESDKWIKHLIDSIPTSHRVRWADINGDGIIELVNLPMLGIGSTGPDSDIPVQLVYHSIPDDPNSSPWQRTIIDSSLRLSHGISIFKWEDDPGVEILTASSDGLTLFDFEKGGWKRVKLAAGNNGDGQVTNGAGEIAAGTLGNSSNRFLASIEPWHGNKVVFYKENENKQWERQEIDTSFVDGHAIVCTDLNYDGYDEIIAGCRKGDHNLYIYQYIPDQDRWERTVLDQGGMSAAGIHVFDANLDGIPDIVSGGAATNNIILYLGK